MKKLSLKIRISLWFTLILTVISALLVGVVSAVSSSYEQRSRADELVDTVRSQKSKSQDSYLEDLSEGKIHESSFLKKNVRLMIFSKDGQQLGGLYADTALSEIPYNESKKASSVTVDGETYLYYDQWVKVKDGEDYWIRGVVTDDPSSLYVFRRYPYLLLFLPLLIGIAFLGGYFLTGKFLSPIRKISGTAESIRQSGDLSQRIPEDGRKDELSELAGTLNGMFTTLEENFEAEKRFASNASHELRTPVSVILAQCEYAFDNVSDPEELYDVLASVQKQGYKMSRLIEALLLFTRMEQHTEMYQMERTDLSALISSCCEDFSLIADRGITLETEITPSLEAPVNKELFTLMVNNLIQNAIRYGRQDGHVWVRFGPEGFTSDRPERDHVRLTLEIRDDGEGISQEDLPHIFDLFYRSDASRNSRGLGLGLPLVKKIAEYHGGSISVSSEKEKGSAFLVTLPLKNQN